MSCQLRTVFVCLTTFNPYFFMFQSDDLILAVPYALAIRGDIRRKVVNTNSGFGDVLIRSSFTESWIFDDFQEYVCRFN